MGGAVFVETLQLQHDLTGANTFEPFVGDGRPGDVAAELFQFFTLIGAPAHRRMQVKAVRVDTQIWVGQPGCARQVLQAQIIDLTPYPYTYPYTVLFFTISSEATGPIRRCA